MRSRTRSPEKLTVSCCDANNLYQSLTLSKGMFLYARLVLDYLSRNIFYTYGEIKDSMDQLPEELTDLFISPSCSI